MEKDERFWMCWHRSLEALVTWSYELLGEAERRLLARLARLCAPLSWLRRGRMAVIHRAAGWPR